MGMIESTPHEGNPRHSAFQNVSYTCLAGELEHKGFPLGHFNQK